MTATEYLRAIKKVNPQARVVVWEENGKLTPKWDSLYTGFKPTLAECEAVLEEVRAEMRQELKDQEREKTIQEEIAVILRKQAIANLVAKGVLTEADKIG